MSEKQNIVIDVIDKIRAIIGPATKEIGSYEDPISPETSVSFFAVKAAGCENVPLIEGHHTDISDHDDEFWFETPEE